MGGDINRRMEAVCGERAVVVPYPQHSTQVGREAE